MLSISRSFVGEDLVSPAVFRRVVRQDGAVGDLVAGDDAVAIGAVEPPAHLHSSLFNLEPS